MNAPDFLRKASPAFVLVVCLGAISCRDTSEQQAEWWDAEQERIGLVHELELKTFRLGQSALGEAAELKRLEASNRRSEVALESLRSRKSAASSSIESLGLEWAGYRQTVITKLRHAALGKSFQGLEVSSGRTYVDATVASIDDGGVNIRHADGSARLRYADLSPEHRLVFGLEADAASAANEKETREAAEYDRWVSTRLAQVSTAEAKARQESSRREENARQRAKDVALARLELADVSVRPSSTLAQAPRSVGTPSYRSGRSSYRYVEYYNVSGCRPVWNPCVTRSIQNHPATRPSSTLPESRRFANTISNTVP